MKTIINNNERVFLLLTWRGEKIFCNLKDVPKAYKKLEATGEKVIIYHFWNMALKPIKKSMLNLMLADSNLNFKVK